MPLLLLLLLLVGLLLLSPLLLSPLPTGVLSALRALSVVPVSSSKRLLNDTPLVFFFFVFIFVDVAVFEVATCFPDNGFTFTKPPPSRPGGGETYAAAPPRATGMGLSPMLVTVAVASALALVVAAAAAAVPLLSSPASPGGRFDAASTVVPSVEAGKMEKRVAAPAAAAAVAASVPEGPALVPAE